jgi:hypothetical protein
MKRRQTGEVLAPHVRRGKWKMLASKAKSKAARGERITAPLLMLPKAWEDGLPTICREPAANPVDGVCLILQGV